LDNWALVDCFCAAVLSPFFERRPELLPRLLDWVKDGCMWMRRAAVVSLVPFARKGRHLDLAYALVERLLGDREDLMHKALGWLLREAGKPEPARLRRFLLRHGPALPRTTLRYAIERFPPAQRQALLKATRKPAAGRARTPLRAFTQRDHSGGRPSCNRRRMSQ
jgi:3-methyladenine DNA glycosylase AlkD